jgi:hypothetical protein
VTLFLAYIAHQQLQTSKKKLKLDLYNKRFEIYIDLLKYHQELNDLSSGEEVNKEIQRNFIKSKEASYYLFSEDRSIYDLLEGVNGSAAQIVGLKKLSQIERDTVGDKELSNMIKVSNNAFIRLRKSVVEIKDKMTTYLNQ